MTDIDSMYNEADDKVNYKSISCEQIPELFLDKLVAKNHFSRFGKIKRFILRPKRLSCTVEYETEDQAERALQEGDNYNGHLFQISYAEKEVAHVRNTEEWVDPEVQAELEAMGANVPKQGMPSAFRPMALPKASILKPIAKLPPNFPIPLSKAPPKVVTETVKVDPVVKSELFSIIKKAAVNNEEKYKVLDARDKLIRLLTVKQTDIKKAKATKGTCPDMCPEKERLMRAFQRQVSSFEQPEDDEYSNDSTISHKKAVKEYSRSSADQEAPLAHELRSEEVLQMTMLYLLHRIADLCDQPKTSIGDWFHFFWDRTRSIRKDITQQELCSLASVELVEQCARFHIHCGARLIAEDPSVFDKKINAENLTKCLQTLKYMYHDLRIKGISCPCEAEFRGYMVLLNLGDANFLFELKQLPEQIQNSDQVVLALKFYNALQNNNYVRFFNMIKSSTTPYLSACILLKYFHKLRVKAMSAIIKSHRGKNEVFLPIKHLTNILGFENDDSTLDFMEYHGLQSDPDGRVLLEKMTKPEIEYSMDRALNIVESKLTVTVGECISGRPLDSPERFETHQPQNSFDANGLLRNDALPESIRYNLKNDTETFKVPQMLPSNSLSPKPNQLQTLSQSQQQQEMPIQTPFNGNGNGNGNENGNGNGNTMKKNLFALPNSNNKVSEFSRPLFADKVPDNIFGNSIKPLEDKTDPFKVPLFGAPKSNAGQSSTSIFALPNEKAPLSSSTNSMEQRNGGFAGGHLGSGSGFKIDKSIFNQKPASLPVFNGATPNDGSSIFQKPQPINQSQSQNQNLFQIKAETSIFQQESIFKQSKPPAISGGTIWNQFPTKSIFPSTNSFSLENKPELQSTSIFGQKRTHGQSQGVGLQFAALPPSESFFKPVQPEVASKPLANHQFSLVNDRQKEAAAEAAEKRLRELQEEQRLKQQQLEEERSKLKALEERREQLRQKEAKRKAREALENLVLRKSKKELNRMLLEIIKDIVDKEVERNRKLENMIRREASRLFEEVLIEQISEIVFDEHEEVCYTQYLMQKYFTRWRSICEKRKLQRKLMNSMPMWVTPDTRSEQVKQIEFPFAELNLSMIRRYRQGQPVNFEKLLWRGNASETDVKALNLCKFLAENLEWKFVVKYGQLCIQKYLKLLITIPNDKEELPGFESMCNNWLEEHIQKAPANENITEPLFYCHMQDNVGLCVRKFSGLHCLTESGQKLRDEAHNSDGLLFFITSSNLRNSSKRLQHLFHSMRTYKPIPIAFIAYDCEGADEHILAQKLGLNKLCSDNRIESFEFFGCSESRNTFCFPVVLQSALHFLAKEISTKQNHEDQNIVEMQNISEWLDCTLGEEMWEKWETSSLENPVVNTFCSHFINVIDFYNKALLRLKDVIMEDLTQYKEFPKELRTFIPKNINAAVPLGLPYFPEDWKSPLRQQALCEFLKKLQLPRIKRSFIPASNIQDWEVFLVNYASLCIDSEDDDMKSTQAAHDSLKAFINQLNAPDLAHLPLAERFPYINYLRIIKPLAFLKGSHICSEEASSKNIPDHVFYVKASLINYQTEPWWLDFAPIKCVKINLPDSTVEDEDSSSQPDGFDERTTSQNDFDEVVHYAEQITQKLDNSNLNLNLNNCTTRSSSSTTFLANDFKRQLDEGLYFFEVAKANGQFDLPDCSDLSDISDEFTSNSNDAIQLKPAATSPIRKRKCQQDESSPESLETDDIIRKALKLIKAVDQKQDSREKLKRTLLGPDF